jgi:hypothetical protein
MLGEDCGAVVVIAGIGRHDARVDLGGEWADYVRERHVSQPGRTVVGGLACPHPVTGDCWVTIGTAGALACVVPHGEEGATGADR